MKKFFILVILLFFHCSIVMGSPVPDTADKNYLAIGIDLFKSGQFKESYENLLKALEDHPENLALNFFLGRAAFEIKDYETAVMAFERILMVSPDENIVKIEMARAFQRMGANDLARQYCHAVLVANPSETLRKNIKNFLLYIDKTEQKNFISGRLTTGIKWDNNIWASPSKDSIETVIGDMNLIGPSSKKTQDWIYNAMLNIDHAYMFLYPNYSWRTQTSLYKAIYNVTDELDIRYLQGQTGPQIVSGKNRYHLSFLLSNLELGKTEYLKSIGFKAGIDHIINQDFVVGTALKFEEKNFPDNPGRDSKNTSILMNMGLNLDETRFRLDLKAENESASDDGNDYEKYISNINIMRDLPLQIKGSLNYNYQYLCYDKKAFFFEKNRQDHQHSAGISLERPIWESLSKPNHFISLCLSYQHTWAYSNIDLYEYDKDIFQLSMAYNF